MPRIGNGNASLISPSAANTRFWALFLTDRFSVERVAMSVTVNV